jgi:hypothetical protein
MADLKNIIRLACDTVPGLLTVADKLTGNVPRLPRGRDTRLEIGISAKRTWQQVPGLTIITAEVKPFANHGGTAVVIANTTLINNVTAGSWEDDTASHAEIILPAAQTVSLATADETDYWLVVTGFTAAGSQVTLAAGRILGVNDGGNYSATVPTPGDVNYLTAAQVFALLNNLQKAEFTENGFRARLSIDANGQPGFYILQ